MKFMMDMRGLRNNNPGNIRHGSKWEGLEAAQRDESFCSFISPEWGIRAIGKILLTYQSKHNLNTVGEIIERWAPPIENNTKAYASHVAELLGVKKDEPIDVHRYLSELCTAIIIHENGMQPYSKSLIDQGAKLALRDS